MKTIDDVIEQCEEIANASKKHTLHMTHFSQSYDEWAEEWTQIAEWLKELKAYKEKETCETCGHYKAYQHGADITTMDDECGGCCSWNSKWIPNTCGDAISRQAVIDVTWEEPSYTDALNVLTEVRDKVKVLPSVTPQQRMGRWEEYYTFQDPMTPKYRCSICQEPMEKVLDGNQLVEWWSDYCPNCGAKMEVEE